MKGSLGTTYEIGQPPPETAILHRLNRWKLQSISRSLLPGERIAYCCRSIIPGQHEVKVLKAHGKASYGGLQVCASVWVCPVCAAKISERRRVELTAAIKAWRAQGGEVVMLTLTFPHYVFQGLAGRLVAFGRARKLMRNRKPWKRIMAGVGLVGSVRSLEVTYGENGWHVHTHELLFLRPGQVNLVELEAELLRQWKKACVSAGLDEPNHHGVQVQDGSEASKYAAKWGMEHELTKSHIKHGRDDHWSPFDLLRQAGEGNEFAGDRFQEYAQAFKGKRQLVWSEGLRKLVGLGKEASDEEIAAKIEEGADLLGTLSREQWRVVLRADRRGELLEVAASKGWLGVIYFIMDLAEGRNGKMGQAGMGCDSDHSSRNTGRMAQDEQIPF